MAVVGLPTWQANIWADTVWAAGVWGVLFTPGVAASMTDNLYAYLQATHVPSAFAAADFATLLQYDLSLRTGDYTTRFQALIDDAT